MEITITESSAMRLREICTNSNHLRLSVNGGGCHGYYYDFKLDTEINKDDHEFKHTLPDGTYTARVLVDEDSLKLLQGSTIDYVAKLGSARFVVKNPNIETGCGCGSSFSIKEEE